MPQGMGGGFTYFACFTVNLCSGGNFAKKGIIFSNLAGIIESKANTVVK